jgi:hypothetical protein
LSRIRCLECARLDAVRHSDDGERPAQRPHPDRSPDRKHADRPRPRHQSPVSPSRKHRNVEVIRWRADRLRRREQRRRTAVDAGALLVLCTKSMAFPVMPIAKATPSRLPSGGPSLSAAGRTSSWFRSRRSKAHRGSRRRSTKATSATSSSPALIAALSKRRAGHRFAGIKTTAGALGINANIAAIRSMSGTSGHAVTGRMACNRGRRRPDRGFPSVGALLAIRNVGRIVIEQGRCPSRSAVASDLGQPEAGGSIRRLNSAIPEPTRLTACAESWGDVVVITVGVDVRSFRM